MATTSTPASISALRQRMQHDMMMRGLLPRTQDQYIRHIRRFAAYLARPPDTAISEDPRNFQIRQHESGASADTINNAVSALRFLYTVTLRRRDLARGLVAAWHDVPAWLTGSRAQLHRPDLLAPIASRRAGSGRGRRQAALCQATGRVDLSLALCPPRGHLKPAPHRLQRRRRDLPLKGLSPRRAGTPAGHDAGHRRLHSLLSDPCLAARVSPHPALWSALQFNPQAAALPPLLPILNPTPFPTTAYHASAVAGT